MVSHGKPRSLLWMVSLFRPSDRPHPRYIGIAPDGVGPTDEREAEVGEPSPVRLLGSVPIIEELGRSGTSGPSVNSGITQTSFWVQRRKLRKIREVP
jgi:hypothetical protein